jgi:hypothetical protein
MMQKPDAKAASKPHGMRIEKLYCWVLNDPQDGGEAIPAYLARNGTWMPLMGADRERMESLRPNAQQIADELSVTIRLKVFGNGVEIDCIAPVAKRD